MKKKDKRKLAAKKRLAREKCLANKMRAREILFRKFDIYNNVPITYTKKERPDTIKFPNCIRDELLINMRLAQYRYSKFTKIMGRKYGSL